MAAKAKNEAKDSQNLIEELRADAIEKDTHLDYLQKKNDELSALLSKEKADAVADANYAASFEDFRMDAMENFPEVDFSSIKLNLAVATSLSLRLAPRMSILKTMLPLNLLKTLEMTPFSEF